MTVSIFIYGSALSTLIRVIPMLSAPFPLPTFYTYLKIFAIFLGGEGPMERGRCRKGAYNSLGTVRIIVTTENTTSPSNYLSNEGSHDGV